MKPYKSVPILEWSPSISNGKITTALVNGVHLYVGTSIGEIIKAEIPASYLPEELIHSAKTVSSISLFSSLENSPTKTSLLYSNSGTTVSHGIAKLHVGPSTALEDTELLFLTSDGVLGLLQNDLTNTFKQIAKHVISFVLNEETRWNNRLTEGHVDSPRVIGKHFTYTACDQRTSLCVLTKLKLQFYYRDLTKNEFVIEEEIILPEQARQIVWYGENIGLVYEDSYQIYNRVTRIFQSLLPGGALVKHTITGSTEINVTSKMVITDKDEMLVLGHESFGLFVNFHTRQPSQKSTIPWKTRLTALETTGEFIIGATEDDEIVIFTSKSPIRLCQTMPTQGRVITLSACEPWDNIIVNSVIDCNHNDWEHSIARPLIMVIEDSIWYMTPVPFSSQFKKLALEFRLTDALELLYLHIPPYSLSRHQELQEYHLIAGWSHLERLNFKTAFMHFRFTPRLLETVGSLLELWSSYLGNMYDISEDNLNRCQQAPSWKRLVRYCLPHLLKHQTNSTYLIIPEWVKQFQMNLNNFPNFVKTNTLMDNRFTPSVKHIEDLILNGLECTNEDSETKSKQIHLMQIEANRHFLDYLLLMRDQCLQAFISSDNTIFLTSFEHHDASLSDNDILIALQQAWTDYAMIIQLDSLCQHTTETMSSMTQLLNRYELGFFIRLMDNVCIQIMGHLQMNDIDQSIVYHLFLPSSTTILPSILFDQTHMTSDGLQCIDHITTLSTQLYCLQSWRFELNYLIKLSQCHSTMTVLSLPIMCLSEDLEVCVLSHHSILLCMLLYNRHCQFMKTLHLYKTQRQLCNGDSQLNDDITQCAILAFFNQCCQCRTCHSSISVASSQMEKTIIDIVQEYLPLFVSESTVLGASVFILCIIGFYSPSHTTLHTCFKTTSTNTHEQLLHYESPETPSLITHQLTSCDPAETFMCPNQQYVPLVDIRTADEQTPLITLIDGLMCCSLLTTEQIVVYETIRNHTDTYNPTVLLLNQTSALYIQLLCSMIKGQNCLLPPSISIIWLSQLISFGLFSLFHASYPSISSNQVDSFLMSRLFILRILEVEENEHLFKHVLDVILFLEKKSLGRRSIFQSEKTLCYLRLGMIKDAFMSLIDPSSTESLLYCEALSHAVHFGGLHIGQHTDRTSYAKGNDPILMTTTTTTTSDESCALDRRYLYSLPSTLLFYVTFDPTSSKPSFWRTLSEYWHDDPRLQQQALLRGKIITEVLQSTSQIHHIIKESPVNHETADTSLHTILHHYLHEWNLNRLQQYFIGTDIVSRLDLNALESENNQGPYSHTYHMLLILVQTLIELWESNQPNNVQSEKILLSNKERIDPETIHQDPSFYKSSVLYLLHKYATHPNLDCIDILRLIPDSWPLKELKSYLTHSIRDIVASEHNELLRESLASYVFLQSRCQWGIESGKYITLTRESTCSICSKRLILQDMTESSLSSQSTIVPLLAYNPKTNVCGHAPCLRRSE